MSQCPGASAPVTVSSSTRLAFKSHQLPTDWLRRLAAPSGSAVTADAACGHAQARERAKSPALAMRDCPHEPQLGRRGPRLRRRVLDASRAGGALLPCGGRNDGCLGKGPEKDARRDVCLQKRSGSARASSHTCVMHCCFNACMPVRCQSRAFKMIGFCQRADEERLRWRMTPCPPIAMLDSIACRCSHVIHAGLSADARHTSARILHERSLYS